MMLSDVSVEEILQESVRKEDIAKDLRLPKHQLPSKDDLESRIDDRISISSSSSSPSSVSLSLLSHCQREEEDGFSPPLQRGEGRGEKEEEGPSKKRREETPRPSLDERGQAAIDQEEERRELGEREKMNAAIFSSSNGEVQRQEHRSEDFKKKKEEDEKKKEEDEKKKKKMCLELDDHMREGRGSPIEKEEQDDCLDEQDMYVDKRGRRRRSEERKEEEKETRISVGLENKKTRALKQCKIDSFFKHPQKSTGEKDKIPFSNLLELSTRGGEEDKAKKSKKEDESDKEREREVASPSLFPSLTPVEGENKEQEEEKKSEEDCASRGLEQDPDTTEVSRVKQGDLHPSDTIENVQNSNKRIHHTGRCETPSLSSSSLRVGAEREDECILAVEDEPERICKKQKTSFSSFSFSALKVVGKGDVQNLSCLASPDGELLPIVDAEERWKSILGHSWYEALREELRKPYMEKCLRFVRSERQKSRVYPPPSLVFNAFKHTPLNEVKVVILGQDPYHQPHQAM
ncbi:uracil-dna glycosylase, partial [Cystoisospora suis]